MNCRCRIQLAEALGPVNRWFCSQAYCRPVDDAELLLKYFIKSGGARDFAVRFDQAMSEANRWYCAEYYGREIHDPDTLWSYYMECCPQRRSIAC